MTRLTYPQGICTRHNTVNTVDSGIPHQQSQVADVFILGIRQGYLNKSTFTAGAGYGSAYAYTFRSFDFRETNDDFILFILIIFYRLKFYTFILTFGKSLNM